MTPGRSRFAKAAVSVYSSPSDFQRLTFDKGKIDKSFVDCVATSPAARAIITAVVGLGNQLGMGLVAEDVETEEQCAS